MEATMNRIGMTFVLSMCLGAAMLFASGCDDDKTGGNDIASQGPKQYPYTVVTTVGMVTDIVKHVAGDKADGGGLMGEGVDPHLYKPTRDDIAAMMNADVVVYSGLMLEGKLGDTLVQVAREGKPVYAVTELIDPKFLLEPPEFAGHPDPHVWMDPTAWSKAVDAVAVALSKYDPANAEQYQARAASYNEQLKQLDAYAKQCIGSIPKNGRVMITAHDAFNYFGRAYDVEVRGIQGLSTESEAGIKDIQALVDLIVARDVKAVFVETSVSEKNINALIEGARDKGKTVAVGGSLFSDAMGAAGTYEGTYIGMMDHNVTTITRALGGEAPEGGMLGKLGKK